jgi:hypothetical protein
MVHVVPIVAAGFMNSDSIENMQFSSLISLVSKTREASMAVVRRDLLAASIHALR